MSRPPQGVQHPAAQDSGQGQAGGQQPEHHSDEHSRQHGFKGEAKCQQDRFKGMSVAQTVGVLEFLKWNIINQSGGD